MELSTDVQFKFIQSLLHCVPLWHSGRVLLQLLTLKQSELEVLQTVELLSQSTVVSPVVSSHSVVRFSHNANFSPQTFVLFRPHCAESDAAREQFPAADEFKSLSHQLVRAAHRSESTSQMVSLLTVLFIAREQFPSDMTELFPHVKLFAVLFSNVSEEVTFSQEDIVSFVHRVSLKHSVASSQTVDVSHSIVVLEYKMSTVVFTP